MATINLNQLNQYIKNYYDQIQLNDLQSLHTNAVKAWFKENLSSVGRYGHRDFERFGSLKSNLNDASHQGRQDGWVSLTEEVPSIDNLTFGTGALYIHGEMEIPKDHPKKGDKIKGDEYHHTTKDGKTPHIFESTVRPQRFVASGTDRGISYGDQGENGGVDPRQPGGFVWRIEREDRPTGDKDNRWLYESITDAVGGDRLEELHETPKGDDQTPTNFNDDKVYNLDNERNHFPFVIINSAQAKSVENFLKGWQGDTGMYDSDLPALAKSSYPPRKNNGINVTDVDAIVDYISPVDGTS